MRKLIIILVLLLTSCSRSAFQIEKQRVLPEAEKAIAAHKRFLRDIDVQTPISLPAYITETLADDQAIINDKDIKDDRLLNLRAAFQAARSEFKQFAITVSTDKEAAAIHLKDGKGQIEDAEKMIKKLQSE